MDDKKKTNKQTKTKRNTNKQTNEQTEKQNKNKYKQTKKLKLNDSQRDLFISTNKQDTTRLVNIHLNLQDVIMLTSTFVKNLGTVFDTSVKIIEHVSHLSTKLLTFTRLQFKP